MQELIFEGKTYISSRRASEISGYSKDYIGQLCRAKKLDCHSIGRTWYISEHSIYAHKLTAQEQQKGQKDVTSSPVQEITVSGTESSPRTLEGLVVMPKIAAQEKKSSVRTSTSSKEAKNVQIRMMNEGIVKKGPINLDAKENIHLVSTRSMKKRNFLSHVVSLLLIFIVGVLAFGFSLSTASEYTYVSGKISETRSFTLTGTLYRSLTEPLRELNITGFLNNR